MGVGTPSDAEAASIALQLLAAERRFAGAIEATGVGVIGGTFLIAGLLALQTQFEFVRDKDGRGAVRIKKKPTSEALLKSLAMKITDLLVVRQIGGYGELGVD